MKMQKTFLHSELELPLNVIREEQYEDTGMRPCVQKILEAVHIRAAFRTCHNLGTGDTIDRGRRHQS